MRKPLCNVSRTKIVRLLLLFPLGIGLNAMAQQTMTDPTILLRADLASCEVLVPGLDSETMATGSVTVDGEETPVRWPIVPIAIPLGLANENGLDAIAVEAPGGARIVEMTSEDGKVFLNGEPLEEPARDLVTSICQQLADIARRR